MSEDRTKQDETEAFGSPPLSESSEKSYNIYHRFQPLYHYKSVNVGLHSLDSSQLGSIHRVIEKIFYVALKDYTEL